MALAPCPPPVQLELLWNATLNDRRPLEIVNEKLGGWHQYMYYQNYEWNAGVVDILLAALADWYSKNAA